MFSCCMMGQTLDNKDQEMRYSADPRPIWDNPEISPEIIADQVEQQLNAEAKAKAQSRSWIFFFNCTACLVDRNSSKAPNELPSLNEEVALELGDVGDGAHKAQSRITHYASASI